MSLNFNIRAERKISFKKKDGKRSSEIQLVSFDCIQTPTKVTEHIMATAQPINAYIDYIRSLSKPERMPVYAEDDYFCENGIISYVDYDWTIEHIDLLNKWIFDQEEQGYTIKYISR